MLPRTAAPSRVGRGHWPGGSRSVTSLRSLPRKPPWGLAALDLHGQADVGGVAPGCGHWLQNKRKRLFTNCPVEFKRPSSAPVPPARPGGLEGDLWRLLYLWLPSPTPGSFPMQLGTPVFHHDNVITEPH